MRCGRHRWGGFTIVELIVVMTVIALLLAIAVPGLSAMNAESRFSAAVQTVNGALMQAYYATLADGNMTAVRFVPGEWDFDEQAEGPRASGQMRVVTYGYVGTSAGDPADVQSVRFAEYFQRRAGSPSVRLPDNVWVAPVEALDMGARRLDVNHNYGSFGQQFVLSGLLGQFRLDADPAAGGNMLRADDFLIVFDPHTGMRQVISPIRLKAYVPESDLWNYGLIEGTETDRSADGTVAYQRYNFTGVVVYPRDGFVALGDDAEQRQKYLRENGRPYLAHRFSGGLVMGTQGP